MFFEADDGHRDFVLNLGTTANGDPIVAWLYGANAGQQTLTGGAGAYHIVRDSVRSSRLGFPRASMRDNNLPGFRLDRSGQPTSLTDWRGGAGTNGAASNANFRRSPFQCRPPNRRPL